MITSASNPKLRLVHRLLESRRQREREGLFVVEGEDLVAGGRRCGHRAGRAAASRARRSSRGCSAKVSTMAHPPRVLGDLPPRRRCREGSSRCRSRSGMWPIRATRHDPASADAFGASVALSPGCADPTGPKALRASAGAVFRVPIARLRRAGREADRARLARRPAARPSSTRACRSPTCWAPSARACRTTSSPAATSRRRFRSRRAESLNVAIAGAIALYEHRRGR